MDKNAIKKYAVWARRELIEKVTQKAMQYGIEKGKRYDKNVDSVNGVLLTDTEKKQRETLVEKVEEEGFSQVMEEIAYTWFNRFIALRFMEVNGYLPSHVRVFTDETGNFKPQILSEALHLDLDGLDRDKVFEMKSMNQEEMLFKYLLIVQCNDLNSILPGMFQKISDYTELLLPDYLLRQGSVIERLVTDIRECNFDVNSQVGQIEVIGWMYQYFNTELNDQVYNGEMSKKRISKELLPAATTIYTPDWAIRYMVQNSLGKVWISRHPDTSLEQKWTYYIKGNDNLEECYTSPEEIKCIDPCMGSGHILAYMFDVFVEIYESYGFQARDAVAKIVENNIYGLDIDSRAAQLSYFAIMMKARQYDRRFFSRGIQPHIYSIKDSNSVSNENIEWFAGKDEILLEDVKYIVNKLYDAKEYGSIINFEKEINFKKIYTRIEELTQSNQNLFTSLAINNLTPLFQTAEILSKKYQVVVTNPPYLENSRFSAKLDKYVKEHYQDEKADLSMVMLKRSLDYFCDKGGYISFITTSSWMFLGSFEKLRKYLLNNSDIVSIVDFGTELFDGKVGHNPVVAWVMCKDNLYSDITAIRLADYCYARRDEKKMEFFKDHNRYITNEKNFFEIPGTPIAYWASKELLNDFRNGKSISQYAKPRQGMSTCDVNRFTRLWHEVNINNTNIYNETNISKWVRYNKGGSFRKWYGNKEYVVYWENDGSMLLSNGALLRNRDVYFNSFLAWTKISSAGTGFRKFEKYYLFDGAGGALFMHSSKIKENYILGLLNSKVSMLILNLISPTLNFNENHIGSIPVIETDDKQIIDKIETLVSNSVEISKSDWDSFETSWDFQRHPLVQGYTLADSYVTWKNKCEKRFNDIKANEEEMNRIFINIYGLQDELTPEEGEKDITIRKADLGREIRSFISYAIGCMFGRYSLDVEGLVYAGGEWDDNKYKSFPIDKDNIIPICDDEYFDDDMVGRFVSFVERVYGKKTLDDNLKFIADALGGKGQPREVIRNYFLNDFYKDHCKIYQKRPIYWLFDSGKKNGFKCLIYMHRYQSDTIARIRTDYVHEQQSRYHTAIEEIEQRMLSASGADKIKLNNKLKQLKDQDQELHIYEEKIHHLADQMISIDLNDGVKHNYAIFHDVLAIIK